MIKKLPIIFMLSFLGSALAENKNPFIGKWLLKEVGGCSETYQFKENGVMLSYSKKEINERSYVFKAINKNIFIVNIKTIKNNGLESCYGNVKNAYIVYSDQWGRSTLIFSFR